VKNWAGTLKSTLKGMPRLRRIVIGVIGGTVTLLGVALIVLPGPAMIIIPLGIAILATEFAWARYVFRHGKVIAKKIRRTTKSAIEHAS
jgi:uncharacterized membrane protein